MERMGCKTEDELRDKYDELEEDLRLWASYRGQTLTRTVRGYKAIELTFVENSNVERSLWVQCQTIADMKFTYVVSCQQYGIQKRSGDPRAQDILQLMTTYDSMLYSGINEYEVPVTKCLVAFLNVNLPSDNHI